MIFAGIDVGSRAVKIVLYDRSQKEIIVSGIADQGVHQVEITRRLFGNMLKRKGMTHSDVSGIVVTGYGRDLIDFGDVSITEITCHTQGVLHHSPAAMTIIDVGGQDSKVIKLSDKGIVRDFEMNDRCAAGTGRFLEIVAQRLEIRLDEFGMIAGKSANPAVISNMCVVFAETEIIGLLARGSAPEDIAAGVQKSLATRVAAMAGRHVREPVIMTGGVALIPGMKGALEQALHHSISIAPDPQYTGALGAALLAAYEQQ